MQLTGPEIKLRMQLLNPRNPDGKPNISIEPFDERCLGSNSYDLHLSPEMKVYKNTIPYGMKPFIAFDKNKKNYSMKDWFYDSATTDTLTKTTFPSWKELNSFIKDNQLSCKVPTIFINSIPYFLYTAGNEEYDNRNPKFLLDTAAPKETFSFKIPETGAILNPCMGYLGSTVEYTETYNLFPYIDGKSSLGRNFVLNHHTAGRGDDGFCGNWTLEIHCLYPTVVYPYMRIGQRYYEKFEGDQKQYNKNLASHYNGQIGPTPAAPIPVDLFIKDLVQNQK
ncbi:MAG: hypothetical protein MJ158_03055 [Alphaproteobacteria bacterium]|nr:hypothetical protein [Alphaproteobacteria bacterium]